jgi:undecaprenyl-diphosphatase
MDIVLALKAIIMGLVEGFTEFLPISSTGHLILAGSLLDFTDEKAKVFEIVIQTGAILAVCWEYRARLGAVVFNLNTSAAARRFVMNVAIAFLPLALLGLLFGKSIKNVLFKPVPVALAFIIGGVLILWIERRNKVSPPVSHIASVEDMRPLDAVKIGLAQAFALIPGTSRSGATIIGGMMFGLPRTVATEFSFFLAVPTLLLASVYSLYKERALLSVSDIPVFAIGLAAAFVSAFLCVRWLLRYISSHDFTLFAWYRIVFGLFVLASAHFGWVVWAE